jgi:hypothetical protein
MIPMITTRKIFTLLLVFGLGCFVAWRGYQRLVQTGGELNQGRLFHDVQPGKSVRFVVRGATDFHLVTYLVLPEGTPAPSKYSLQLSLIAPDGSVREQRSVSMAVARGTSLTRLQDGSTLAQSRMLHVLTPAETAELEIRSPDGRVLLRADRLAESRAEQDRVVMRSGRPPFWFAADELRDVLIHRWTALPAPAALPTVRLPPLTPPKQPDTEEDSGPPSQMQLGPHRAVVFNVMGPGTLSLRFAGDGNFRVEHLGVGGSGQVEGKDGRAELQLPAGPSSVTVLPLEGASGTLEVEARSLRSLGRTDHTMEPSLRRVSAWLSDGEHPLRFPMYGKGSTPRPVRLTAHALDLGRKEPLRWRFLDASGRVLRDGELEADESDEYDPFSAVERGGHTADLGMPIRSLLIPPARATVLEVDAGGALVEVDALVETRAQAQPLHPFEIPLTPSLRWQDVPVLGPRWLMLRPLNTETERHRLYAPILRTPRIVQIGPLPAGPWMSVEPRGGVKKSRVIEVAQHPSADQAVRTALLTERSTSIVVESRGKDARRVVASCELPEADEPLGGNAVLLLDGRPAAKARITSSVVRLEASASPGVHRVRVKGVPHGHCTIAARESDSAVTVQRSVYKMSSRGLMVDLRTRKGRPVRLHYAVYAEGARDSREMPLAVTVDSGSPSRRPGSATTLTPGQLNQVVRFTESGVKSGPGRGHMGVAIAAVQLGDDLPSGRHRIKLRALTPGRYWARFWIEGRRARPEVAASFITTEEPEPGEEE